MKDYKTFKCKSCGTEVSIPIQELNKESVICPNENCLSVFAEEK
ncbi:MAG: hypothetical protein AABY22_00785 [Nanoarchaeota archaeon]